MAYQKFKLNTLEEKFNICTQSVSFIPKQLADFAVNDLLLQTLADNEFEQLSSEKAKAEFIINPVLKELHKQNRNKLTCFSGYEFNVDKQLSLNGFCDFILSAIPNSPIIKSPVFCLVEAKKSELEEVFGQCGAEMIAANIFNERHNNPQKIIYGCVTNAFLWVFLKLENSQLLIDPHYIPLTFEKPHSVLSILQWIVNTIESNS
jgi:hypothetical protein